jgi:hypothetical protein
MQQTTQLQVSPPVGASVLRSAIRDSQQLTSPIGFLFFTLPRPPCAVMLENIVNISGNRSICNDMKWAHGFSKKKVTIVGPSRGGLMRSLDSLHLKLSQHLVINLSPRKKNEYYMRHVGEIKRKNCHALEFCRSILLIHKLAENINRKLILDLISKVDRNPETEH